MSDAKQEMVLAKGTPATLAIQKFKDRIQSECLAGLDPGRQVDFALSLVRSSKDLAQCDPVTVVMGVLQASRRGLSLNPALGHAYLVPFKEKGVPKAQFIPGYRGMIHLMEKFGGCKQVRARIVYQRDEFEVRYGTEDTIVHRPYLGSDDPGRVVGAYAVAVRSNGEIVSEWVPRRDIDRIMAVSKGQREGRPWDVWFDEMSRKSALRRLHKWIDSSPELADLFPAGDDDGPTWEASVTSESEAEAPAQQGERRVTTVVSGEAKAPAREPGSDDGDPPPGDPEAEAEYQEAMRKASQGQADELDQVKPAAGRLL